MTAPSAHTLAAVSALAWGHEAEHDFPGWLADVLARLAAQLGSVDKVVEGRPGSWEAAAVLQLLNGTVANDADLSRYR
jgi:hypothetical protein